MIRVLVVDDEAHVRNAIRKMVDWEKLGMTVKEAVNGVEALEINKTYKPHLVIVDMQMPFIDGVELMKRMSDEICSFIVVSGYDDFRYLRHAIAHKVVDYLLKPLSRKEINDALNKAIQEIEARDLLNIEHRISSLLECLMWKEPVQYSAPHINSLLVCWPKSWSSLHLHILYVTNYYETANGYFQGDCQLLRYKIEEEISKGTCLESCWIVQGQFALMEVVIVENLENGHKPPLNLENVASTLSTRWRLKVVKYSKMAEGIHSLRRDYGEIKEQFLRLNWSELSDCGGSLPAHHDMENHQLFAELRILQKEIGQLLHRGTKNGIQLNVNNWAMTIKRLSNLSIMNLYRRYMEYRNAMLDCLDHAYINDVQDAIAQPKLLKEFLIFGLHTDSLTDVLEEEALRIFAFIYESSSHKGIRDISTFLNRYYHENISLEELAARFHFSKNYLCKAFKEMHGCTITDYITKLRMEHARSYIVDQGYPVQQAAEVVGITNYSYFSRLYKKHFGYPPSGEMR